MQLNFPIFPEQASSMAGQVDALYLFLVLITTFFSLLIAILILFFAIKYRRTPERQAEQIHGSTLLEIVWTVIPLGISMVIFVWGAVIYYHMERSPSNPLEIYGVGKQWMWKFQHPGGQREINTLHVPTGRDVKVTLISQDVIHSFFVPGVPREAGRAAEPLRLYLVQSHAAGDLPPLLLAILRHQAFRHGGPGCGDDAGRLRQLAGQRQS